MPLKFFVLAISLIAMAGEAQALGRIADVALYDRAENHTLPVYFHDGRYYVAGKPGNDYQITLRNRQPAEIMTVISVDGINAVTGETAHWSQGGYVLGAAAAYAIGGWRKNLHSVARFYFTELDASYAARSARPENVGVIGVAIFRPKTRPAASPEALRPEMNTDKRRDSTPTDRAAGRSAPTENLAEDSAGRQTQASPPPQLNKSLGTGHGTREHAPVLQTSFERAAAVPDEVITIYYDSYQNLLARGVIRPPAMAHPAAFPGRFVPDPS